MIDKRPAPILEAALALPAALFSAIAKLRGRLYENETLKSHSAAVPVISIGNLTAGGTGKTPITSFLATELTQRGVKAGIVSRGYGGQERGPARVAAVGSAATAKRFGDEPSWLAATHPNVPVVVCGDRVAAINELLRESDVDIVLCDDGFQHRRLKRDLDIVIVDATEPDWHYRPLPLGRMREGFESLVRAKFAFVSKVNQGSADRTSELIEKVKASNPELKVVEFESVLGGFVSLKEDLPSNRGQELKFRRIVLMSAIARPQLFEKMVKEKTGAEIVRHFSYRDHASFSSKDLAEVEQAARASGADAIVVTEKDATKLGEWRPSIECFVTRLIARPKDEKSKAVLGELYEAIGRLVR